MGRGIRASADSCVEQAASCEHVTCLSSHGSVSITRTLTEAAWQPTAWCRFDFDLCLFLIPILFSLGSKRCRLSLLSKAHGVLCFDSTPLLFKWAYWVAVTVCDIKPFRSHCLPCIWPTRYKVDCLSELSNHCEVRLMGLWVLKLNFFKLLMLGSACQNKVPHRIWNWW